MWVGLGILVVVIVTWLARFSPGRLLAAYHDGLPIALSGAWVALIYAVVVRREWLAAVAGAVVLFHLAVVIPRRIRARRPVWAEHAPTVSIAVANVYVRNRTPGPAAAALVATEADVIVVNEHNPAFRDAFEAALEGRYHGLLEDFQSPPDYAVALAVRGPLGPSAALVDLGDLRVARVEIPCGDATLTVLGVHLAALTEPGGYGAWRRQVHWLTEYLAEVASPFVVAGDFNASAFRPAMRALMRRRGLHDAHDAMGQGLTRSLKLADRGVVAHVPAFTRVDHALLSEDVAVVAVRNLPRAGSDHHPFVMQLAVRQPHPARGNLDRGVER
jgi:endonuclease/exonuclease/phosphatase (EEP) superfamily protein YafD